MDVLGLAVRKPVQRAAVHGVGHGGWGGTAVACTAAAEEEGGTVEARAHAAAAGWTWRSGGFPRLTERRLDGSRRGTRRRGLPELLLVALDIPGEAVTEEVLCTSLPGLRRKGTITATHAVDAF